MLSNIENLNLLPVNSILIFSQLCVVILGTILFISNMSQSLLIGIMAIITLLAFKIVPLLNKLGNSLNNISNAHIYSKTLKEIYDEVNLKCERKEKLVFKKALVNLGDEKQENLNQLIESYKNELFSYAYQEKIVKSAMDTFISLESVREYYNLNKLNFKLNQEIINARYLKINSENYNLKDVVKRFRRFKQSDKIFLDSISLQFSSYYFNDSLWINKDVFFLRNIIKANICGDFSHAEDICKGLIKIMFSKNNFDKIILSFG